MIKINMYMRNVNYNPKATLYTVANRAERFLNRASDELDKCAGSRFSSGRHTLEELRERGHPYARKHGSIRGGLQNIVARRSGAMISAWDSKKERHIPSTSSVMALKVGYRRIYRHVAGFSIKKNYAGYLHAKWTLLGTDPFTAGGLYKGAKVSGMLPRGDYVMAQLYVDFEPKWNALANYHFNDIFSNVNLSIGGGSSSVPYGIGAKWAKAARYAAGM